MSLEGIRGRVSERANAAAPSLVDGKRSKTHRSSANLGYSFYGSLMLITDMGPTGATGEELRHTE
jgi:hypothetical protein